MKNGKHSVKGKGLFIATLIAAMFLYAACPQYVSLGESVDILPPAGQILYPDSGETPIKGSFLLKGFASDDEGVQAVSVVFENMETKQRTRNYPAQCENNGSSSTSVVWSVMIDNESTGT